MAEAVRVNVLDPGADADVDEQIANAAVRVRPAAAVEDPTRRVVMLGSDRDEHVSGGGVERECDDFDDGKTLHTQKRHSGLGPPHHVARLPG